MSTREQEANEYARAMTKDPSSIKWWEMGGLGVIAYNAHLAGAASEAKRRDEREAKLVGALRPFAKALDHIKTETLEKDFGYWSPSFSAKDFVRARQALAELERGKKEGAG